MYTNAKMTTFNLFQRGPDQMDPFTLYFNSFFQTFYFKTQITDVSD